MKNLPVCCINDTRWEFLVIVNQKQGGGGNANFFWYMHTTIFFILKDIYKKRSIHEKLISWLVKRGREKLFFLKKTLSIFTWMLSAVCITGLVCLAMLLYGDFLGFFLACTSISIVCFLESSLDFPNCQSAFLKLHPNYLYNLIFYIG